MSRWAELVFHVLAHVRSAAPASVYDPAWVAFVAGHSSRHRTLHEDVALLEAASMSHDTLAEVQLLAWLFESTERTVSIAELPLEELRPSQVDAPEVLGQLVRSRHRAAIEVLRAAAELEAETFARLPPARHDGGAIARAFAHASRAAPWMSVCRIEHVRPLRLRGRVRERRVWIGLPCAELGPSAEHVAFQAAHEATVTEISERARASSVRVSYLPLEQSALFVLRERAARVGLAEQHARWLAHFGALPPFEREAIAPALVRIVDEALRPGA